MTTTNLEEFAAIVRQHQSAVCAVAFGVTGDRALSEDIAQETFVAAWRNLSTLRDTAKLGPWLRGIARNLAHKSRRNAQPATQLEDYAANDDLSRDAIAKDEARVAWKALCALPEAYREALVLYYWDDLSAREVSEALGISEAAAMQRLSRGRALVREDVQRIVEGTLRRDRPGAALTAAIVAAIVAATVVSTSSAIAAPASSLKSIVMIVLVGILATFGASIAVSSGCRTGGDDDGGTASHSTPVVDPKLGSHSVPPRAVPKPEARATAAAPDEADPDGRFTTVIIRADGEPDAWLTGDVRHALTPCFAMELVDHPAHIDIAVVGGKIATTTTRPIDGAPRVIVLDPHDGTAIAMPDLAARLAAGNPTAATPDDPNRRDHDAAIELHDFVDVCAKARLEGQPIAGPDATHHLVLTGNQVTPKKPDRQAFTDLDIASGASRGPASAPVTVVTFLDIAQRFGGASFAAWSEVIAAHPRDVRIVVKLCPSKAPGHQLAAEAVYAANAQGALWPMLDYVATHSDKLAIDDLVTGAAELHLDVARFRSDLELHTFRDAIELDLDQMTAMEIGALPSALVNGKRVHGALPASEYARAIDEALAPGH